MELELGQEALHFKEFNSSMVVNMILKIHQLSYGTLLEQMILQLVNAHSINVKHIVWILIISIMP